MSESAVTDFPDPDSPTTPNVSPLLMWNDNSFTAVECPILVENSTVRPSTFSREFSNLVPVPSFFKMGFIYLPVLDQEYHVGHHPTN